MQWDITRGLELPTPDGGALNFALWNNTAMEPKSKGFYSHTEAAIPRGSLTTFNFTGCLVYLFGEAMIMSFYPLFRDCRAA